MQCKELELVLESEGLGTLSPEAREHLAGCADCQGLLADVHSIVAVASTLPAEIEPPARVWISLRSRLEAEGLIKEPAEAPQTAAWWKSLLAAFQIRPLTAVAAGILLVAATFFYSHRMPSNTQSIAMRPAAVQNAQPQQQAAAASAALVSPAVPVPAPATITAKARRPAAAPSGKSELAPSPSESASSTVAADDTFSPDMQLAGNSQVDASFRQNLRTLNQFIAECQHHLKQNPQDEMAREYLNMAYQQKADLLAAMMDNGRSEH